MNSSGSRAGRLRIAILSSAPSGGAGIAALRVRDALALDATVDVDFIDISALSSRISQDAAPLESISNGKLTNTHFTVEFPGYTRGWLLDILSEYDILNVHWACGLIGLGEIDELSRRGLPILLTCHDYYNFTGGCHYPAGCDRNSRGCIACPQVDKNRCSLEVISENLKWKARILARPNVHLSAPSQFLMNEAVLSGLVTRARTHVLRNPYEPESGIHNLSGDDLLRIVMIADSFAERRKGMALALDSLAEADARMTGKNDVSLPFQLHLVGAVDETLKEVLEKTRLDFVIHGRTENHRELAGILKSCQLLLTCSYEDNWPNVLVEAGAYGVIPVVGPGHGCEEFVHECGAGAIAHEYTKEAFAETIIEAAGLYSVERAEIYKNNVIRMHSPAKVGAQYKEAIRQLLHQTREASPDSKYSARELEPPASV